ncbi:MAG TPA: hypothetical protein VGN77_03805 [Steroidobacteraceae bacterium]|nr:hypothetical protein [Steroidobacteraceae bacterium]
MIERGTVDQQPAILSYVNDKFEPVDKHDATLLVASLDDGRKLILVVPKAE